MIAGVVNHVGTEEQKKRVLPSILAGEAMVCMGYSEPDYGSDVASITTRAVRDGDEWVINGAKMWTTMAHAATWLILLTRTNLDVPKHKGLTMFLLPTDTPGISVEPVHTMGTERTNATFYDDVRVGNEAVLGDVDGGWHVMSVALSFERGVMGGTNVAPQVGRRVRSPRGSGAAGANGAGRHRQRGRQAAHPAVGVDRRVGWPSRPGGVDDEGLRRRGVPEGVTMVPRGGRTAQPVAVQPARCCGGWIHRI
jgi:hypothetical protein